jgi:hypothetical protein
MKRSVLALNLLFGLATVGCDSNPGGPSAPPSGGAQVSASAAPAAPATPGAPITKGKLKKVVGANPAQAD